MDLELTATKRDSGGKGSARRVRREQLVPAVLYGPKTDAMALKVSAKQLEKLLKGTGGESKLLNLKIEEGGKADARQVLIREVQIHPYRRRFLHVDFYEVPLDHPIVIEVPVELVGDSIGVQKGGELNLIRRTLSVRCLPNQIPESVKVDVTKLDLGQVLHVEELDAQVGFELVEDKTAGIVNVEVPEAAAEETEEAPAAEAAPQK